VRRVTNLKSEYLKPRSNFISILHLSNRFLYFFRHSSPSLLFSFKLKKKKMKMRKGMMVGRGKYLLMADSDGATKFSDVERVISAMKSIETAKIKIPSSQVHGMVVGSRHKLEEEAVARVQITHLKNFVFFFLPLKPRC